MKKFLIAAAAASLLFFGNGADAAPVDNLNASSVQTQEMSNWPKIRDQILGRRNKDRHHRDYHGYRDDRRHHYGSPPPPPHYCHGHDHYGPPPRR